MAKAAAKKQEPRKRSVLITVGDGRLLKIAACEISSLEELVVLLMAVTKALLDEGFPDAKKPAAKAKAASKGKVSKAPGAAKT
jgi:hypothetical protein